MTMMSGQALLPEPNGDRPPIKLPDADLFTGLVVSNPPKHKSWFGVRESVALHVTLIASAILVPIFWPSALPETDYVRVLIYNPPPPPPPLPPKGGGPDKAQPAQPVTPDAPEKPKFSAPVPTRDNELRKEDKAPESEQAGSETGSDLGMEGGMEIFGDAAGVPGGVPGGVVGGVVGGTGDGPVLDYDRAPRPIKMTKPVYPQAAFIKKIEGVVEVEILIDVQGRVLPRRIIRSIPLLDEAAIETVKQWLFEPALKNGRPVSIVAVAPVGFRIY